jgi:hypothetical protein
MGQLVPIRSASLFTPATGATVLIFYSNGTHIYNSGPSHFDAYFLLLDNRTGGQWNVNLADRPLVDGNTWDKMPTSMIVVHTAQGQEVRISASAILTPIWNRFIDAQLAAGAGGGATVTRSGNPTWSWVAFPDNLEHLSPSLNYLCVDQDLSVALDDPMPDYIASITYYRRLVVSSGTITGWVQRWEYWVEGGLFTQYVSAVLRPYTILGAEKLNDLLASGFLPLPPGTTVARTYFLPGTQTDATNPGEAQIFQGYAEDDATIVLQTG